MCFVRIFVSQQWYFGGRVGSAYFRHHLMRNKKVRSVMLSLIVEWPDFRIICIKLLEVSYQPLPISAEYRSQ